MDSASLPNRPPAPSVTVPSRLDQRARQHLETPIEFIANPAFDHPADEQQAVLVDAVLARWQSAPDAAAGSKTHLGRLCEAELLSAEQEAALFCQMNYLKYQAERMRQTIDLERLDAAVLDAIDGRLERARQIRDCIIEANMRLVLSIVKKFVTPQQTCDEMLSDGILTLMQAVEKFDFDRGFRFSTYAYRSVARHAYRSVKAVRSEESRLVRDADEWAFEQDEDCPASSMQDRVWSQLRERMTMLLEQLDRRDQFIIRSRYALGAHRKAQSFQAIADRLGVSKERARQLERRAVEKLRQMTSEQELDELFGARLV